MSTQQHTDEVTLLAMAIQGHDMPGPYSELRAPHFIGPADRGEVPLGAHAWVWAQAQDLRTGGSCTTRELMQAIANNATDAGPLGYWLGLQAPPEVDVGPMVARLQASHQRRQMLEHVAAVDKHLRGGTPMPDVVAMWDGLRERLAVGPQQTETDWMSWAEALAVGVNDIEERREKHQRGEVGQSSGIRELDEIIGPIEPDPILLMARPKMGKTFGAQKWIANTCIRGGRVAVFSMEMNAIQFTRRILAGPEAPSVGMRKGDLTNRQMAAVYEAEHNVSQWDLAFNGRPALRIQDLQAGVRESARRFGPPELIVVDHVHLMQYEGTNENLGMAKISAGIKEISIRHNCPVLCLAQLNRAAEKRADPRPIMSDLRGSGAWEQDASLIIGIHKEQPNPDKGTHGDVGEWGVVANRHGGTGVAFVPWNVKHGGWM